MPNTITHCLVQKLDRKYKYIKLNIFTAVLNISLKKVLRILYLQELYSTILSSKVPRYLFYRHPTLLLILS